MATRVQFRTGMGPYNAGDIATFEDEHAERIIKAKHAVKHTGELPTEEPKPVEPLVRVRMLKHVGSNVAGEECAFPKSRIQDLLDAEAVEVIPTNPEHPSEPKPETKQILTPPAHKMMTGPKASK